MDLTPTLLKGHFIDLEPITESHREDLRVAAHEDPAIFTHFPRDIAAEFDSYFDESLDSGEDQLPFIVRDKRLNVVVGTSRYMNISPRDLKLEIGHTWYRPSSQATAVNPEAKLLLMGHAFEHLKCARVEYKTDERNARSRRAMEKMGAKFEGVFRRHLLVREGRLRSSAYYSILDDEWPEVKAGLAARVEKFKEAE